MPPSVPELGRFAEPAFLILAGLRGGPRHGYAILLDIEAATGRPMGPGTLYGALARLEARGLIEALPPEDRHRPYRLTALGSTVLAERLHGRATVLPPGRRHLGPHPG